MYKPGGASAGKADGLRRHKIVRHEGSWSLLSLYCFTFWIPVTWTLYTFGLHSLCPLLIRSFKSTSFNSCVLEDQILEMLLSLEESPRRNWLWRVVQVQNLIVISSWLSQRLQWNISCGSLKAKLLVELQRGKRVSTGEDVDEDKAYGALHNALSKAAPWRSAAHHTCITPTAMPLPSRKQKLWRTLLGAVILLIAWRLSEQRNASVSRAEKNIMAYRHTLLDLSRTILSQVRPSYVMHFKSTGWMAKTNSAHSAADLHINWSFYYLPNLFWFNSTHLPLRNISVSAVSPLSSYGQNIPSLDISNTPSLGISVKCYH